MHVLNFMFLVFVICINNEIGMIVWFGVIILQFLGNELRENLGSILDFPKIPSQSELLKWLPLDRGYFKFYFWQKEKVC